MSMPKHSTNAPIPSRHRRLAVEQVVDFGTWIDARLAELELRFADFVTNHSSQLDSQRRRNSWREEDVTSGSNDADNQDAGN